MKIREKICVVLEWAIGIALAVCLFLGGLGFFGYVVAFCIGGDTATEICTWIYKTFYVWLIKIGTITTVVCFILMYFNGNAKWQNPIKYWKQKIQSKRQKKEPSAE